MIDAYLERANTLPVSRGLRFADVKVASFRAECEAGARSPRVRGISLCGFLKLGPREG